MSRRIPLVIDRRHPAAVISVILMALSTAVRIVYYAVRGGAAWEWVILFGVPVLAAGIFIAAVLLGEKYTPLTAAAVLAGVIFFIVKAFTFASAVHTALCICLYLAVLALYSLSLKGVIPTKKLLYPLFGAPLAYHIFVEDMQLYILADVPPPPLEWLPEVSVLCIMAALLTAVFAMRREFA